MAIWHRDTWDDIGSAVSEPAMQQLLQRWYALKADSGPDFPARDDLLPRNPAAILPRLLWLEHDGQGDFIYRHYGLDIQRHSQFDMTGRRVSEFGGQMGQFFLDRYRAVLERRCPLYNVHYADRADGCGSPSICSHSKPGTNCLSSCSIAAATPLRRSDR